MNSFLVAFFALVSSSFRTRAALQAEVLARANPLWGAPRIHGELLKLGIEVAGGILFDESLN